MACTVLRQQLPSSCTFTNPTGGYFIWVTYPEHVDIDQLNEFAREHYKVSAISGKVFSSSGAFGNCVRLSIAFHTIDRLEAALQNFCKASMEFLAK